MKKKRLSLYCIMITLICQFFPCCSTFAATDAQRTAISQNCSTIHDTLRTIQSEDSRTRVYLGSYYETILSDFIKPFNVRLVENNIANSGLSTNQSNFATAKQKFSDDFIVYQKSLEELVDIDCVTNPDGFYDKLLVVREQRATMVTDVNNLSALLSEHIGLVQTLRSTL